MSTDDELSPEELVRLRDHLDAIDDVQITALRAREPKGMPEVNTAITVVDALAGAYSERGKLPKKWKRFTVDFMPSTLDLPSWYRELRCLGVHNLSAGSGLVFADAPELRGMHGSVLPSGGSVFHAPQFVDDAITAYYSFRELALHDVATGRRALRHFDQYPPVRLANLTELGFRASAAPSPDLYRIESAETADD